MEFVENTKINSFCVTRAVDTSKCYYMLITHTVAFNRKMRIVYKRVK